MSENKIPELLLISQGSAFMVNSLETNIKKSGIMVTRCDPNVRDFDEFIPGKDIVLIFAGEFVSGSSGLFSYISSKCSEDGIHLCLVGYPNELAVIEKTISAANISAEFPRPFDMKEFTARISALASKAPAVKNEAEEGSAPSKRHSILMCDDDMIFLKMVQEWLQRDYQITILKSGLMAVPYALSNQPELILLDYEMPVMNGPKVLEALRADAKTAEIPVVFLTGHSDKDSVMEVMKLRPQGYMLKSTKKEDMLASVSNFFATGKWKNVQA